MNLSIEQIKTILKSKMSEHLVLAEHSESGHFYRHIPTNSLLPSVTTKCNILGAQHLKAWAARLAVDHLVANISTTQDIEILKKQSILIHQDQFEDAGLIGTRGHSVIEEYLNQWIKNSKQPQDIREFIKEEDSRVFAIARSAELFCKDFNVIPIASEMFVVSLKHKFAGTLDSLMMVLRTDKQGEGNCQSHDFLPRSKSNPNKVMCLNCGLVGEYEFSIVDWKSSNSIMGKVEYAMQVSAYWKALSEMTGLKPKKMYVIRLDKGYAKYESGIVPNLSKSFKSFIAASKIWDWLNDGEEKLVKAFPRERISLTQIL